MGAGISLAAAASTLKPSDVSPEAEKVRRKFTFNPLLSADPTILTKLPRRGSLSSLDTVLSRLPSSDALRSSADALFGGPTMPIDPAVARLR